MRVAALSPGRQVEPVARVKRVERKGAREEEDARRKRAAPRAKDPVDGERNREEESEEPCRTRGHPGDESRDERERRRAGGDDSRGPAEEDVPLQRTAASS